MRLLKHLAAAITSLTILTTTTSAHSQQREPLRYLVVVEGARIHTHNQRVNAYSNFDLTFDLHKHAQHIRLSLEPNHDILAEDAQITYLDKDGNIRNTEKIVREDHKVFMGRALVEENDGTSTHTGWARIVVRKDGENPLFEGAFTINGNTHNIQLNSNYMATKHALDPVLAEDEEEFMTVYRDSDIARLSHSELKKRADQKTCNADTLSFNSDPFHPVRRQVLKRDERSWGSMSISNLLGKRQGIDNGGAGNGNSAGVNLRSTIGDTSGCPSSRKVALIGIATDCSYTSAFTTQELMRQNIINVVNTASDLYQSTFNITIGLRNLTVSDAECPGTAATQTAWNVGCTGNTTIEQRLNLFSQWRGTQSDTNAYWSLFTTCNTGAEVGLAWLGQLCNHASTSQTDTSGSTQSVTGANVVARTSATEWQVFAHESGHTFGAVHDCDSSVCANSAAVSSSQCCPLSATACDAQAQYMMNPYSDADIKTFSPCSIGNVCSALGRNSVTSTCLTDNKGVVTITGQQCGNGIVEEGEDCDCGGASGCAENSCCNPTTCKFNTGAVCDPSNEGCCTSQCQYSASGTVCRASTGVCDPQEVCTGSNSTCPRDSTANDGTSCGTGLQCASGQCTSRDQQCKTVMGSYTTGNDTYACNSQTCLLSCASPDFGSNVCYSMQQNFLDGTPCGGGGKCSNGVCAGSTVGGEVSSWIKDNKTLVIALAAGIGGLLLIAILGCCVRACRRPKGKRMPQRNKRTVYGSQAPQAQWNGPMPNMSARNWQPESPPPSYPGRGQAIRYA